MSSRSGTDIAGADFERSAMSKISRGGLWSALKALRAWHVVWITRVFAPDPERMIRPEEDPSLVLMSVNKQQGENPLQARTVWFFAKVASLVLGLFGLAALALPRSCVSPRPA